MSSVWQMKPKGSLLGLFCALVIAISSCSVSPEAESSEKVQGVTAVAPNAFSTSDYSSVLKMAVDFYDANKCGKNVAADNVFSWRGACHTSDGSDVGLDLTGGYHDAGDHVKFHMPGAFSASMLAWALYENKAVFDSIGYTTKLLSTLKYFSDYFLKCHPNANTYYYQVGDGGSDHSYWGPPENQSGSRVTKFKADLSNKSSDVSGQTAASLALMYLLYKDIDATYAAKCLQAAKELYAIATSQMGLSQQESYYITYSFYDDLSWAAIWLSIATADQSYLANIKTWVSYTIGSNESKLKNIWALCWDDMYEAVFIKMAQLTGDQFYKDAAEWNIDYWTGKIKPSNAIVTTTPGGLRWLNNWGALRYTMGGVCSAMMYFKQSGDTSLKTWAGTQIDYMLGSNPRNMSYVIGFGSNYPKQPHHRAANPSQGNASYVLKGALVGGPDRNDNYTDSVHQYEYSEVALDYNANLVGALAAYVSALGGFNSSTSSVITTSSSSVSSTSSVNGDNTGKAYAYGLPGVYGDEDAYMQAQYVEWKGQYITASGAGGALRVQRDAGTSFDTVSEGIGYGMILAAVYNDQPTFDGLFKYSLKYRNANKMMLWQIDQYGNVIGSGGATDADEDIAFALVYASKKWGNSGSINYGSEATSLINALMAYCVEPGTYVLKPGDSFGGTSIYNPSYFAPSFFRVFKAHTGDSRWDNVIATGYAILDKIQQLNAGTGFSPDWCTAAGQNCGKSYELGYDAIRVPYRIGLDWSWYGNTQARDVNNKFIKFFDSKGTTNTLRDGYTITGTVTGQWWSPTFASMIASAAMSTNDLAVARKWYDISKNKQDPYTNPYHYFGSCLRMLNLTYMTGNLQDPVNGNLSSSSAVSVSSRSSSKSSTGNTSSSVSSGGSNSSGYKGRLTGVNWFGFETSNFAPHGLWSRDYKSMLKQIKDLGFNHIRLPWCNAMLSGSANGISFGDQADAYTGLNGLNLDLKGLTPLQIMDKIVDEANKLGLGIVLDNHSKASDGYMVETLWYTAAYSEQKWIDDWVMLVNRYKSFPNVIGADLKNEPHGRTNGGMTPPATWGYNDAYYGNTDWKATAEKCGQAILAVNPNIMIIIEGIELHNNINAWWGGNLSGVKDDPITGIPGGNLVYSPHEYGPEVYPQPWFSDPTFPANMQEIWDIRWWFIHKENIAPLYFGEFGIKEATAADPSTVGYKWFTTLLALMGKNSHWAFWCMNPNSGDTGGILMDDWVTVNPKKYALIKPYLAMYDEGTSSSSTTTSSSKSSKSSVVVSSVSSSSVSSASSTTITTYVDVPAKIEAESYAAMSGIQTESCSDAGGGSDVGWVDTGDWLEYGINVTSSGSYTIELRTADSLSSGAIDILIDGVKKASFAVPNTGGWQTWTTIQGSVTLTEGHHILRVSAAASPWNLNWINLYKTGTSSASSTSSSTSSSVSGVSIPAKIEAESYTAMSGIQTESCAEGSLNVGWVDTGDWLEYNISVATAGEYTVSYRVASQNNGGKIDFLCDGLTLSSTTIPATGGWQSWVSITTKVNLTAGSHKIRLYASGSPWNLNYIDITSDGGSNGSSSSSSSAGQPAANFTLNSWNCNVQSGGCVIWNGGVGNFNPGQWIAFNNVQLSTGYNNFSIQYSTAQSGSLALRLDSATGITLATINYASTGGWNNYTWTGTSMNPSIAQGTHTIYIVSLTGAANLGQITINNY